MRWDERLIQSRIPQALYTKSQCFSATASSAYYKPLQSIPRALHSKVRLCNRVSHLHASIFADKSRCFTARGIISGILKWTANKVDQLDCLTLTKVSVARASDTLLRGLSDAPPWLTPMVKDLLCPQPDRILEMPALDQSQHIFVMSITDKSPGCFKEMPCNCYLVVILPKLVG